MFVAARVTVDVLLAIFLIKTDRSQTDRLRDCDANRLVYKCFSAYRCLAYFQRDALIMRA